MSSHTRSLFYDLRFAALELLWDQTRADSQVRGTCPCCGSSSWRIYDDPLVSGEWGYCGQCRFGGDPLEWTARLGRESIWRTLERLRIAAVDLPANAFTPAELGDYMRYHVGYRRKIANYWHSSYRSLRYSENDRGVWTDRQYDVFRHRSNGRALRELAVVGAGIAHEVETLFHPRSYAPQLRLNRSGSRTRRRGSGAGKSRIFQSGDWNNLLLIPFEDVPGRISGFQFVRDYDDPAAGRDHFFAIPHAPGNHAVREAGVTMLSIALGPVAQEHRDSAFVIYDPKIAMKMQLRHLLTTLNSLPIVGAIDDGRSASTTPYAWLAPRNLVFYSPDPGRRRACLAQCCRVQGTYVEDFDVQRLQADVPWFVLHLLRQSAVAWDVALRRELARMTPDEAGRYLNALRLPADVHNRFLLSIPTSQVRRLRSAQDPSPGFFRSSAGNRSIVERPEGWFDAETGECLLNGLVRVDEIISFTDGSREAHGRFRLDTGEEEEFAAPMTRFERQGLVAILRNVLPASLKTKLRAAPGINAQSLSTALTLQRPKMRTQADVVGFRNDYQLHLRNFTIALGGKVDVIPDPFISRYAPAADFAPPSPLSPLALQQLSLRSRESRIFWATATCIAHNVLAGIFGWPTRGIGLVGEGAQSLGRQAAALLGCRETRFAATCAPARFVRQLEEAERRHNWPTFAVTENLRRCNSCLQARLSAPSTKSALVGITKEMKSSAASDSWVVIRSEEGTDSLNYLRPWSGPMLINYFHDLLRRRTAFHHPGPHTVRIILTDLAHWFEEVGGNSDTVLRAEHLLEVGDHFAG